MMRYSIKPRTRKQVKGYGFLSLVRKYKKQLMDTGVNASKKVVHKAGEFLEIKLQILKLSQTMIILRNKNLLKK